MDAPTVHDIGQDVLQAVGVQTDTHLQIVRAIRNACIGTFTHHNEIILPEQQRAWWARARGQARLWLYGSAEDWVGFGMLAPGDDGHWWATLGVLPAHRSRGYGTAIYRHLIEQAGHVWIEIGCGNPASYQAARKAGFMPVTQTNRVCVLVAAAVERSE